MQPSLFTNWLERASSGGHILTGGQKISPVQLIRISELNNRTKALTANMEKELVGLIAKRDAPDVLPSGVITHLDSVFRDVFDRRRRLLKNKYLDKGTICEQDSMQLASDIDGEFYEAHNKYYENEFICGSPDIVHTDVKDIKSNYDKDSFDKAELTTLYTWQVRFYLWLCGFTKGELVYCLVNNTIEDLNNQKYYLKNALNDIDGTSEEYKKQAQQIERNMIFDISAWKKNYPSYDFENTNLNFSISKVRRIKRFDIELLPEHISFIKKRVKMCREYLIQKEKKELEILKNYSIEDYNSKIEFINSLLKKAA
tara:strand:- start:681 stop:1619 length:939 start_codon:yes stop_codon:yes gene_type:complete